MPSEAPTAGADGATGNEDTTPPVTVELETVVTWAYASLVLRQGELWYLSNKLPQATEVFVWLRLLGEAGEPGVPLTPRAHLLAEAFTTSARDSLSTIGRRAASYLDQIRCGLDCFGHPPDYVPLVRFTAYLEHTSAIFEHAQSIEDVIKLFEDQQYDEGVAKRKIQQVLQAAEAQLGELGREKLRWESEMAIREAVALRLITEFSQLEAKVKNADQAFRQAVAAQADPGGQCSFLNTVACIGSLVASTGNVYTAIADAALAFGEAGKTARTTPRSWRNDLLIAKQLISGGRSLAELKPAWASLSGALRDPAAGGQGVGQVVMAKSDVDKITEPFLNLPEAQALRAVVAQFLELAQMKNNAVLTYTQAAAAHDTILNQIDLTKEEINRATTDLALSTRVINADGLRGALARHSFECRASLVRLLYQTHLAIRYFSISSQSFELISDALPALRAKESSLRKDVLAAFERMRTARQKMLEPKTVKFTKLSHPDLIINPAIKYRIHAA